VDDVLSVLSEAKGLAQRYRALTGKPLGVTGEVAEYEAARILGLELAPARMAGYDATETAGGGTRRLQIKGRCILPGASPGQRIGSIDVEKEFDAVLLVLLDPNLDAFEIVEASGIRLGTRMDQQTQPRRSGSYTANLLGNIGATWQGCRATT
jgi:hypothetical protein